jgi:hypothetical protein
MSTEIIPTGAALGAEIRGVDLARPNDDETFAAIERAYNDHAVIFFRDPRAPLGWGQGDAVVLSVRFDRRLDRRAGGGEVDGASAQQPPRLREHRLAKGADEILLGESGAANGRLGLLPRCGGGPAHDWKTPLCQ